MFFFLPFSIFGFRAQGLLLFRVQGSEVFFVQGLGFRVQGLWFTARVHMCLSVRECVCVFCF